MSQKNFSLWLAEERGRQRACLVRGGVPGQSWTNTNFLQHYPWSSPKTGNFGTAEEPLQDHQGNSVWQSTQTTWGLDGDGLGPIWEPSERAHGYHLRSTWVLAENLLKTTCNFYQKHFGKICEHLAKLRLAWPAESPNWEMMTKRRRCWEMLITSVWGFRDKNTESFVRQTTIRAGATLDSQIYFQWESLLWIRSLLSLVRLLHLEAMSIMG